MVPQGTHKGLIEGGLLSWARHSVKILAKPDHIPGKIVLDITELGLGDTLHVSDLPLPEGVSFAEQTKLTVVTCIAPKGLKADEEETVVAEGAEAAPAAEAEAAPKA